MTITPQGSRAERPVPAQAPIAYGTPGQAGVVPLPEIAERPGRCLPGGLAVLTALAAAGGTAALLLGPIGTSPAVRGGAVAVLVALTALTALGLARGRPGSVWMLTRHGAYHGTVRRTGLLWISPLLVRRRVDTSLRHWRSSPIEATDAGGTPLQITVLVVWRVRDTARAAFGVHDHVRYLREQVEAAVVRCVSRLPADDFHGPGPTLRATDRLADDLTRIIVQDLRPVGVEVFSAQPVRVDYAPAVASAMRRAQLAALDARHRRAALDDALTAVGETVRGLLERGLVDLDDYERKALVRDLTVAYCTAHVPDGGAQAS
ncbi:SPFH domain-containing protein [Streptomyces sp. PA03-1a]|nr:SPFH domain-containing protein [Streptomyces sp. PA03-1a]MDX2811296.1 SPFH domain-containing protein [Streptomyces sp. PA03-5A]